MSSSSSTVLAMGQTPPDFAVETTASTPLTQQGLLGHYTVIYFYPKDSTLGCTTEGRDFNQRLSDFKALNTIIYGASMDSMKRHNNFKAKQGFEFELISDPDGTFCHLFGVYQLKKNFGIEYMGIVRSTFLFDPKGILIHEWRKVKVKGHAQEVLETIQTHQDSQ
ncbi:Thiol peroxidase, Bcp-type [hydrothermal vent metagenome]|uniref:thioredoxin-dependent peroxiredoxin n=1 Tax=hydrothermal vent metagenome TaxID=652676 RepID=A0A3B0WS51_9ZZZZ